eukprot:SAG11_NODE_10085_length_857_cov_0.848285_2_plen_138_part_01
MSKCRSSCADAQATYEYSWWKWAVQRSSRAGWCPGMAPQRRLAALLLRVLLLLCRCAALEVDPAVSDPPWPGGGFPTLPWATWDLQASTAGFFLGNTSGPNSAAETGREASLGIVGLGWQLGLRRADGSAWAAPGGLE